MAFDFPLLDAILILGDAGPLAKLGPLLSTFGPSLDPSGFGAGPSGGSGIEVGTELSGVVDLDPALEGPSGVGGVHAIAGDIGPGGGEIIVGARLVGGDIIFLY